MVETPVQLPAAVELARIEAIIDTVVVEVGLHTTLLRQEAEPPWSSTSGGPVVGTSA
jgi:hypothetical protein